MTAYTSPDGQWTVQEIIIDLHGEGFLRLFRVTCADALTALAHGAAGLTRTIDGYLVADTARAEDVARYADLATLTERQEATS